VKEKYFSMYFDKRQKIVVNQFGFILRRFTI